MSMTEHKTLVTLQVDDDLKKQLDLLRENESINVSKLLRNYLRDFCNTKRETRIIK